MKVQKNNDLIDAWKLSRRELVKYAQETSERRYGQDILHGGHEKEIDMMELSPVSIWERLLGMGKFKKNRSKDWQEVES